MSVCSLPEDAEDLLLHVCCGPCAIWPLESLTASRPNLRLLLWFYNPNVQPLGEFQRRRDSLAYLVAKLGGYNASLGVDFSPPYDPQTFLALAAQTPIAPERCFNCYSLRLKAAARAAKEKGVKYFSTTLLFSRQQNQELIIKAGREAELPGVTFYEEDFRLGWKKGRAAAKDLGLYAQKYCGCVYGAVETG